MSTRLDLRDAVAPGVDHSRRSLVTQCIPFPVAELTQIEGRPEEPTQQLHIPPSGFPLNWRLAPAKTTSYLGGEGGSLIRGQHPLIRVGTPWATSPLHVSWRVPIHGVL